MSQHSRSLFLPLLLILLALMIASGVYADGTRVVQAHASPPREAGGAMVSLRPTLDPTRKPLTTQPVETIRAELTATVLASSPTPSPTPTAMRPTVTRTPSAIATVTPTSPQVPHVGASPSSAGSLSLLWIGFFFCVVGLVFKWLSSQRS
ncbi:hypothetical protein EYB53_003190 [Candidatus Chloroploca sp. M-50]|uniref:Uncharacterized protein n=1 Tax=Candidatus Chloroploca mongolica TaxID=2528176 RepID=A0ABS4D5I9_9CHLR|nr:hypothetical protein [Candidatus Chloroploca mongolica]MBP1464708.1 hypothetical protein [Candidatus Chloroploca mongolica]